MLIDRLKKTFLANKDKNPLFVRSLLKEVIQFYILDYIYNSEWGSGLIFKGGTCLRFCFDLTRLSEDLDFDIETGKSFDVPLFASDLKKYFCKKLQFSNLEVKIAGNKRTIYFKFPVLADLGMSLNKSDSEILHVRIDLGLAPEVDYQVDVSVKSTPNLSFLVRHYSIEELFAGKLSAILTRETIEGTVKVARFKGRDYYDLIWFLEKGIKPDWRMVSKVTGMDKKEALAKLDTKIKSVTDAFLKDDLLPFFENRQFVEQFVQNFHSLAKKYISKLV